MKTSYDRDSVNKKKCDKSDYETHIDIGLYDSSSAENIKNQSTVFIGNSIQENAKKFSELIEAIELEKIKENSTVREYESIYNNYTDGNVQNDEVENSEKEIINQNDQPKSPKKKKKWPIVVGVLCGLLVLTFIALIVVYNLMNNKNARVDSVEESINSLFVDPERSDVIDGLTIEDIVPIYNDIVELDKKGVDVSQYSRDLYTVGYYLEDSETLDKFESNEFDLTTTGMMDDITKIKKNTEKYSISSLALTIMTRATNIEKQYNEFISLRDELNRIDLASFDETKYRELIVGITHIPNKIELDAICDNLVANKAAEEARKQLHEAEDESERLEAESRLAEAEEEAKRMQEELENTKQELQQKADEAANMLEENQNLQDQNEQLQQENNRLESENSRNTESVQPDSEIIESQSSTEVNNAEEGVQIFPSGVGE